MLDMAPFLVLEIFETISEKFNYTYHKSQFHYESSARSSCALCPDRESRDGMSGKSRAVSVLGVKVRIPVPVLPFFRVLNAQTT